LSQSSAFKHRVAEADEEVTGLNLFSHFSGRALSLVFNSSSLSSVFLIELGDLFFGVIDGVNVVDEVLLFAVLESSLPVSIFGCILLLEDLLDFSLGSDDLILNFVEVIALIVLLFTVAV